MLLLHCCSEQESQQDLLLDNPLSMAEDSSWNKYFQDEELIAEVMLPAFGFVISNLRFSQINKDLERLTPLGDKPELFESDDTIQVAALRFLCYYHSMGGFCS